MKKLRKLAAGLFVAGTALCVSPAVAFMPVVENLAFAEDDAVTAMEGDSFDVSVPVTTVDCVVRLADDSAELIPLSQYVDQDESGNMTLYLVAVINTPGQYELIVEDIEGVQIRSVSVNVMPADSGNNGEEGGPDNDGGRESGDEGESGEDTNVNPDGENGDNSGDGGDVPPDGQNDQNDQNVPDNKVALVDFLQGTGGEISGTTPSGEFKPGETMTLKAVPDKGNVLRSWTIRSYEDGRDVTSELGLTEEGTFVIPDYPIRISANFEYILVHEIEFLDVTEKPAVGKAFTYDEKGRPSVFTGHVADNTDSRFFLLAEIWTNEYDTNGVTSSKDINTTMQNNGTKVLTSFDLGDKYNYSVKFMTTEGYEFADDVKLKYNGKEYSPERRVSESGGTEVTFSGFLSFGEQTNPKETKTSTKTVTRQETKTETVTQYVYNTYTYTTYQYVTRVVSTPVTSKMMKTRAAATGDTNNTAVWIALAIAAGGGVVSGILVGRRRKRRK